MKYAFVTAHKGRYRVRSLCRALGLSPASYYASLRRGTSSRAKETARLDVQIRACFKAHRGRYGSPRVTRDLRADGHRCGENRVARRMRALSLRAKAARRYQATTQSRHTLPVAPNLLEQDFHAAGPNQKWVSDVTFIGTGEGWLYLAVVMDLYSRLIVGYALSTRNDRQLAIEALQRALWRRRHPRGVIVHSDRGSPYCSDDYQALLDAHGLVCSMSKKGDCFDNAAMESFFHSLKVEAIHGERFETRFAAQSAVHEYIDPYYNTKRRHSATGYQSPLDYETANAA